jgi:peptide/nickel transport system permease protein
MLKRLPPSAWGLFLLTFCAVFANLIVPYDPFAIDLPNKLHPPNLQHWFGTDALGRDVFSRVIKASQTSLSIGLLAVLVAIGIGVPLGLIAGYKGGLTSRLIMRGSEIFLAFPPLLLPLAITAALGRGVGLVTLAIGISWFPWYVRIARSSVLAVREQPYITAAQAIGVGPWRMLFRHVLPNSATPVLVQATMDFGYMILAAAALSFIGLGARPPQIEWGLMVAESRLLFLEYWWTAAFPGLAICIAVFLINWFGDNLRDRLDPSGEQR